MGAWGYYDDVNDSVADAVIEIREAFLQKYKKKEEKYINENKTKYCNFVYDTYKDKDDSSKIVPGICLNILSDELGSSFFVRIDAISKKIENVDDKDNKTVTQKDKCFI
jgi:hypothetical protein